MSQNSHQVTIRDIRVLRGPSLYAYMPVLKITLDIGEYEQKPSNTFPGFSERLITWLPGLHQHECGLKRPGGFIERLQRGTYLAHICEHVTLELQGIMGFDVTFGKARTTDEYGVYTVLVAYREEVPARAAFETALRLTLAAMNDEPFDIEAELEKLLTIADSYRLGPSTGAIVDAARERDIPILRLNETGSLVQLGYGVNQKRILASETSLTSAIAVDMCQEKPLTNRMLRAVGVPVPDGRSVTSAEDAWAAAQEIGLPVVVKPEDGNQGKGVSVNLNSELEVQRAYEIAATFGSVLVERFIEGDDYRLLVVGGKMIAAARRDPAMVCGDGVHTVRELVDVINRDPRRRPGHSSPLTQLIVDEAAELVLSQQRLTADMVPKTGQIVKLRRNANLSTGGTATDVTDDVHPANAQIAELAAQILALDVAGIDMLCRDISRPLAEQHGAIVEVNAAPGLRMHMHPTVGTPRNAGEAIVEMLYPGKTSARIPIIAVTGTNGKTTVTNLIGHMFETAHKVVGRTSTEGVYIGQERILSGDCSGPRSAQAVLLHPRVEVAVLETARGGILREGLAFDSCTVGVVTNISSDHLGLNGINTIEELAKVKQVVVEAVERRGSAVLNADDPMVAEMAAATDARVVYFSTDPDNHILASHLANAGSCVYVDQGRIFLCADGNAVELIDLERVPFTYDGKLQFQVQNALAATAAAWSAGLNPALIARALSTFKTDEKIVPGRFNVSDIHGVQVIVDYGHNTGAMKAMAQAILALDKRKTVLAIGLPGDRRDEDLIATFKETLAFADEYVLYDLTDRRGRAEKEVPHLLLTCLSNDKPFEYASSEANAVWQAWRRVQANDRLVIIADMVDGTLEILHSLAQANPEDASCESPIGDNVRRQR
jgi:cyanophycin synthetase